MPVDLQLLRSEFFQDGPAGGGRCGRAPVPAGSQEAVFPRASAAARAAGRVVLRKLFLRNLAADDAAALAAALWLRGPVGGGDRWDLALGTAQDTAGTLDVAWLTAGRLAALAAAGSQTLQIQAPPGSGGAGGSGGSGNAGVVWPNGGFLWISDEFLRAQTVAETLRAGEPARLQEDGSGGVWIPAPPTSPGSADTALLHPLGCYLGRHADGPLVATRQAGDADALLSLADPRHDDLLGTGDGVATAPALAALACGAWGVCGQPGRRPRLTTVCGGVSRTVDLGEDGTATGWCTAGKLDLTTGAWTTPLAWSTPPDAGAAIRCDWRENCYQWSGDVATVRLADPLARTWDTDACCCGVAGPLDLRAAAGPLVLQSAAGGVDASRLTPHARGSEEDTITLTATSATAFTASGVRAGALGGGTMGTAFAPVNPATGTPYFTLAAGFWTGVWAAGETVQFPLRPPCLPVWLRQTVPPGAPAHPPGGSGTLLDWQWEA